MKKKNYLTGFFVLFITLAAQAQAPGYLGRRIYIEYSDYSSPSSPAVRSFFGGSDSDDNFRINTTQVLTVGDIVKNRMAVELSGNYFTEGVSYGDSQKRYKYKGSRDYPAKLSSYGLSLGFKFFRRQNLAPYGAYTKWDGFFLLNNISYKTAQVYQENDTYIFGNYTRTWDKVEFKDDKISYFSGGVALSFGKQRIFANRIIIDYGMRTSMTLSSGPAGYNDYQRSLASGATSRVFFHEFVGARIGIGFLVF